MSPTYSGSLGFQVGLSSNVRESVGMLKRGPAISEAVVVAVVDFGRVDFGTVVEVGFLVDVGSDSFRVIPSCVFGCGRVFLPSSFGTPSCPPPPPPPVPPQNGHMQIPPPLQKGQMQKPLVPREAR